MLNDTIISASHILTPLWSEQIVKQFSLDYRYSTVLTLFFNGASSFVSLSDKTAGIAIALVCTLVLLFFLVKKYAINFRFNLLKGSKESLSVVNSFNSERETFSDGNNNYIEKFLFDNQQFFIDPPRWIASDIFKTGSNNYEISSRGCFLDEGTYKIEISENLKFTVYTSSHYGEKKVSTRVFSISFQRGDRKSLFEFMTREGQSKQDMECVIYTYPQGVVLGDLKAKKGDRTAFFGYYNPKLEMIIDWIDHLEKPSRFNQPRQFSVICYGGSGTGKTSIVKRMAEYTGRNIVLVNLFEVKKKKDLMNLFYCGNGDIRKGFFISDIDETIFFIDEFDKVVKKLKTLLKENKAQRQEKMFLLLKADDKEPKPNDDKDNEVDWDIDDLLEIFCGSYIPDKRMIVVACNDLQSITEEYPHLVRPGRLTPIHFDYGDKALFKKICKDYTDIDIPKEKIPDDYRFVQANLTEFLNFKTQTTETEILENLDSFRPISAP